MGRTARSIRSDGDAVTLAQPTARLQKRLRPPAAGRSPDRMHAEFGEHGRQECAVAAGADHGDEALFVPFLQEMITVTRQGQYQVIMPDAVDDRRLCSGIVRSILPDAAPAFY